MSSVKKQTRKLQATMKLLHIHKTLALWPETINNATIKYWAKCGSESIQHSNSDFSSTINANRSCTNKSLFSQRQTQSLFIEIGCVIHH